MALHGSLAEIPAVAVMQLLEMGAKSGMVHFDVDGGDDLRVWLEAGRLKHASCGDKHGFDAAAVVVHLHAGTFQFHADEKPVTESVNCSVTELLLEASRQLDEGARTEAGS